MLLHNAVETFDNNIIFKFINNCQSSRMQKGRQKEEEEAAFDHGDDDDAHSRHKNDRSYGDNGDASTDRI